MGSRAGPICICIYNKPHKPSQTGLPNQKMQKQNSAGRACLWWQFMITPRNLNTSFVFSNFFGHPRDIPAKISGYPAREFGLPGFRRTYRTFWPPPVHAEDPHPTRRYPDRKVWVWVPSAAALVLGLLFIDIGPSRSGSLRQTGGSRQGQLA